MERYLKRTGTLFIASALLFSQATAQQLNRNNVVNGPVSDDEYFVESVLFTGVELPDILDGTSGTSSYDLEGEGSVTVGSLKSGGFPRVTIFGGTSINSNRTYDEENVNHEWWEGAFFAPRYGIQSDNIDGDDSPNGDDIADYVVESALEFGAANEEFSFSPAATLVVNVGKAVSDNVRLYVAHKDAEGTYVLNASEYCWVEDGYCVVDISSVNSIQLVREVFDKCPVRNEVAHGYIGSLPNCLLICDKGYTPDDDRRYCVESEGSTGEDEGGFEDDFGEDPFEEEYEEPAIFESEIEYPQGYFKYRGSKGNYDRELDIEGLSGEDKRRAKQLTAGSLKTVGESDGGSAVAGSNAGENDSFLNYLLSFRGKGTDQDEKSETYSAQGGDDVVSVEGGEEEHDGETYSSAPLLPSTGAAGIFWILAAVGLGMMAFAVKRK